MSEQRLLQDYLNDITESITDIKEFTKGITFEDFLKGSKQNSTEYPEEISRDAVAGNNWNAEQAYA
jgi:uncharacterized protein with HEPN domain